MIQNLRIWTFVPQKPGFSQPSIEKNEAFSGNLRFAIPNSPAMHPSSDARYNEILKQSEMSNSTKPTMKSDEFKPRIDQIETQWSMVRQAAHSLASADDARRALVMRYASSIRAYVLAMTKSEQDADELSQDVIVRILNGDFGGADREKGRFRDFLKVAVRNMVRNHWAKSNRRKTADLDLGEFDTPDENPEEVDPWISGWRNNLLELTWAALAKYEEDHAGRIPFTILKLRSEFPAASSTELAGKLSKRVGREFRADTTRQQLRRARLRFAEFLVEEIANGIEDPQPERIQEELICLELYEHIRDVLPEKWGLSS